MTEVVERLITDDGVETQRAKTETRVSTTQVYVTAGPGVGQVYLRVGPKLVGDAFTLWASAAVELTPDQAEHIAKLLLRHAAEARL